MRERGYREVRMWVPDTRTEAFAREAQRACIDMNRADATDVWLEEFLEETAPWSVGDQG